MNAQITPPRIYLASAYQRRDRLREYAADLQQLGWHVTSTWLSTTAPLDVKIGSISATESAFLAQRDIEDIKRADIFLTFTESESGRYPSGGRHVEFGMAMALHKPILIVGPKENVFHTLISCGRRFRAWGDLLDWIEANRDSIVFRDG